MPLDVLYEDNHLLAVAKPPGVATQGAKAGCDSLVLQAKEYLRQRYHKPGNVYLGVVSRLDLPVSGVVVFARTSKAAARLNEQFRNREVEKLYWAWVDGRVEPSEAECVDWVTKDAGHQRMAVMNRPTVGQSKEPKKPTASAQQARLKYKRLKVSGLASLL
ncbi:MAG TPA: RNA pseudouridine synthase, partial [Pirellulales bacterium]